MSDQDGALQKLLSDPLYQKILQKEHWQQQGQPWRTEPEIDVERQQYLDARRHRDFKEGKFISPLKDVSLSRADIEWLLATHENGHGPIDWNDLKQHEREGLYLSGVDLRGVDLSELPLAKADLSYAHLEEAKLVHAHLENATLYEAILERANLTSAHLQEAMLVDAHLQGASLNSAHLEGSWLANVHLEGADLSSCFFDVETKLHKVTFYSPKMSGAILADVRWGDVNLAVVDWSVLSILGDEVGADQYKAADKELEHILRLEFVERATRAYRQLSIVLRNQGLNDDANRFAYRAQLMQRIVYRRQKKSSRFLGSLLLDLITGYGYRPMRSFIAYLIVILAFATSYFIIGRTVGPALTPLGSVIFSMTSFHGRGFFPGGSTLDDPLTVLAALEAFIGLLIEVTFIATLTRRLFGG